MTKRSLVLLTCCLCMLVHSVTYSTSSVATRLQSFVSEVYQDYAAGSFDAIYAVMYPSIQGSISEEDYVQFQRHHFERLRLELSNIEVGEVSENPTLARTLRQLLPEDENLDVYGVDLSYRAHFVRGVRFNQNVSKTVYVAIAHLGTTSESLYLLWDPSSMEDEETEQ